MAEKKYLMEVFIHIFEREYIANRVEWQRKKNFNISQCHTASKSIIVELKFSL